MAYTVVQLNTETFVEVATEDGANVHLPDLGQAHRSPPDKVRLCVAAAAADCTDQASVPIVGFTINDWYAAGVPIPSGEMLFGKWASEGVPADEQYVVVS